MTEKIIILSLCSIAICSTTWEGMILQKPADWLESKIGIWLCKPLFSCFVCATLWWSALICLIMGWHPVLAIPAMGLSAVISLLQHD